MKTQKNLTTKISDFDNENGCLKKGPKGHVWKFVHSEDFSYQSKRLVGKECDFNWMKISKEGIITVKGSHQSGYAWDGCTPKFNFLHVTWGIFDGCLVKHHDELTNKYSYKPYTYYASMIHDVIYQYKRCVPVSRRDADLIFYEMLRKSGFMWAWPYFAAVFLFGWVFRGWGKKLK